MNLNELKQTLAKDAFGMTVQEAHAKNVCISCKKAPRFYSEAGQREYKLSGMCEPCFDKMWKDE